MFDRVLNGRRGIHVRALMVVFTCLAGCASVQNTPKQDYVWAMWDQCKQTDELRLSTMSISRVEPDGRYWSNSTTGPFEAEWPRVQACMNAQFRVHPYLDWLKARSASAQASSGVIPPTSAPAALSDPVMVPVWNVGDWWEYAYKSPSDNGSYVWSVDRLEVLDGTQHYVIKSGTREIFYRASDLASSIERVDGVVVLRHTPARMSYSWPLAPRKVWDQDTRDERPVDRQTTNRKSTWAVERGDGDRPGRVVSDPQDRVAESEHECRALRDVVCAGGQAVGEDSGGSDEWRARTGVGRIQSQMIEGHETVDR